MRRFTLILTLAAALAASAPAPASAQYGNTMLDTVTQINNADDSAAATAQPKGEISRTGLFIILGVLVLVIGTPSVFMVRAVRSAKTDRLSPA